MLATLLSQSVPAEWGDFLLKAGLGLLSFMALCYGGFYVVRYLLGELKESRNAFLLALDKQHADHTVELNLLREIGERQTRGLHEAIEGVADEIRSYTNGRGR